MSETPRKTASQIRSAAKDGKAQKIRRRAAYFFSLCYLCGQPLYRGTDRTGYGADDLTTGHLLAHSDGGTYSESNTNPVCATCNKATGTRDLRGIVPAGPAFPSIGDAIAFLRENDFPEEHVRTGIGADVRNASRKARYGF